MPSCLLELIQGVWGLLFVFFFKKRSSFLSFYDFFLLPVKAVLWFYVKDSCFCGSGGGGSCYF